MIADFIINIRRVFDFSFSPSHTLPIIFNRIKANQNKIVKTDEKIVRMNHILVVMTYSNTTRRINPAIVESKFLFSLIHIARTSSQKINQEYLKVTILVDTIVNNLTIYSSNFATSV